MNVACWHHVMTDVIVVALGDFSHGIKKQCNGLERGNLELNGKPMTLQMLKDCWEKGPDASGTEGSIMLFRGITREAFEKNSKNRMNVSLAAKVQSNSMVQIMKLYGSMNEKCTEETYESLIEHCTKTNEWADVMNNSRHKGCVPIDDPNHEHCYQLLSYASYHFKWKSQAEAVAEETGRDVYLPVTTYEDIIWTCLGVVITARKLLTKFPLAPDGTKNNIVQRNHGTDDCEMLFCKSRNKNPNADAINTNHAVSGSVDTKVMNDMAASTRSNNKRSNEFNSSLLKGSKVQRKKFDNNK